MLTKGHMEYFPTNPPQDVDLLFLTKIRDCNKIQTYIDQHLYESFFLLEVLLRRLPKLLLTPRTWYHLQENHWSNLQWTRHISSDRTLSYLGPTWSLLDMRRHWLIPSFGKNQVVPTQLFELILWWGLTYSSIQSIFLKSLSLLEKDNSYQLGYTTFFGVLHGSFSMLIFHDQIPKNQHCHISLILSPLDNWHSSWRLNATQGGILTNDCWNDGRRGHRCWRCWRRCWWNRHWCRRNCTILF